MVEVNKLGKNGKPLSKRQLEERARDGTLDASLGIVKEAAFVGGKYEIIVMPTAQAQLKELFLEHYEKIGTIYQACLKIGVKSRQTPYHWCKSDPVFKERFEEVQKILEDRLSQALIDTVDGKKAMLQPQVTAAIFLLKSLNPRKYQDKLQGGISLMDKIKEIEIKTVEVRVRGD
jgi:hypothetical protein